MTPQPFPSPGSNAGFHHGGAFVPALRSIAAADRAGAAGEARVVDVVLRLAGAAMAEAPRYFQTDGALSPENAPMLERLSKALGAAGIGPRTLDGSEDSAMRLAIVASLLGLQMPPAPATEARRTASALPKWRLTRVLSYVDANIAGQITLADLAAVAGMSRMYFASQFRASTGFRPHDYVLRKRIERAQEMLVATSDSLVEIALSVGFQTQAHFTTIFRKIVGETPHRWRREQH
ncbi:AraC family transcriptional regulator [Bosea caraganae]|uniref:AraC family transcriptional regulator n=1 Tax=Bosea caraganae TaxID=2763117 RepID=A0A370L9X1_9HYPH|nr:AraC family transcriptional regulator [Bosea caraganae]RDJ21866.1 AraC family transcriptional regulator [Bosea caraganae]RDJ28103.1 AraC family transcriptional regulator [Bosea caraganae]